MDYIINETERQIEIKLNTKDVLVIKEFEKINKRFLPNTADKYETVLVFIEAEEGLKALIKRVGYDSWYEELNLDDIEVAK